MASSILDICNQALSECPAGTIASLSEKSQSAYEVNRAYPIVIAEFVEEFKFDFANTRAALAVIDNDRSGEWLWAYSVPANMGSPLRILPNLTTALGAFPLLAGQSLAPVIGMSPGDPFRIPYVIADGIIYCNAPEATLEFLRTDVDVTKFPALFARAAALEIAARIVMPLLKSRERQRELMQAAEVMKQRALAENLNRIPTTDYAVATEVEVARAGWIA